MVIYVKTMPVRAGDDRSVSSHHTHSMAKEGGLSKLKNRLSQTFSARSVTRSMDEQAGSTSATANNAAGASTPSGLAVAAGAAGSPSSSHRGILSSRRKKDEPPPFLAISSPKGVWDWSPRCRCGRSHQRKLFSTRFAV
jgi:hypothetical protein